MTDRTAWLGSAAVSAFVAATAPAQAQVVCTNTGLDRSCVNTGISALPLRSQTAAGGNASGNNSGTISGATPDNIGRSESILVFTQFGGNATAINSGSLPNSGFSVTTENLTPGPNGDATGTNTASGAVAAFFQVETGFQSAGTGGTATGTNAGSVGQFFQVDTLKGGNATGTNSGTVGQFFQVSSATGGDVSGNNSGTVGQNFLVNAAAGGNATGTNSGGVATSFVVSTGFGLVGNVTGTNSSTGTVGTDFQVITGLGEVNATNAGRVGGNFQVQDSNSGVVHTVTALNSGSVIGAVSALNGSGGDTTGTNTGSIGGNFKVSGAGGNVTATNTGSVGQVFNVSNTGNGITGNLIANNSGTVGSAFLTLNQNGSTTATNSGTVNGVFRISAVAGNATGTNSGTVNGDVLMGSGTSSFTNSGTINGANGTAIQFNGGNNNALTLLRGSAITGNILGAGAGDTLNFAGGPGTFTYGAASGFSGFNQVNVNSGTVILNGTNAATNIAVTGGGLQVGDAADPTAKLTGAVNVTGGTLSGHGTVVGNVIVGNGATLAPGGSVGTLSIQGNLVMTTAMSYLIDVSSTGASSTAVSGTAALGGTVQVFSSNNTYRLNSPYTILTSAGLGGTQFNGVAPMTGVTEALTYSGNNVQLTLTSALGQLTGLNANQRAVAISLDTAFNKNGSSGPLGGIINGNVPLNLTQASGELGTGSQQTTFDAMNQFLGVLMDPFIGGRGDGIATGAGASSFAEENAGASAYAANGKARSQSERDAYGMITKAPPMADSFTQRWSVWAAGFGGAQSTDGNAAVGSNAVTSRIAGTAVGADYRFSPFTIAGFALAGGGTSFSLANALGTGHSDLFQAGAYVRHVVGPAYISAALAYGWQDVTTDRTVTIAGSDRLHAEFNANAFSGRVEGGYRFATPWMGVTPYAAGQFTTFDLPAYAESALTGTNAFALAYNAKSVTDARSELGLRTDKSFALPNGILTLRSRFAWAHDFNPDRSIAATFQALSGASFVVNGAAQAQDSALTTVSAEMKWMNGWSAAATFEGEFSDVTRSYAGKGVVRYQW